MGTPAHRSLTAAFPQPATRKRNPRRRRRGARRPPGMPQPGSECLPTRKRLLRRRRSRPERSFDSGRFSPSAQDDKWSGHFSPSAQDDKASTADGHTRPSTLDRRLSTGRTRFQSSRRGSAGTRASRPVRACVAAGLCDRRDPSTPGASRPPLRMTSGAGASRPPLRMTRGAGASPLRSGWQS